jgi:hypothetical protein
MASMSMAVMLGFIEGNQFDLLSDYEALKMEFFH